MARCPYVTMDRASRWAGGQVSIRYDGQGQQMGWWLGVHTHIDGMRYLLNACKCSQDGSPHWNDRLEGEDREEEMRRWRGSGR